jgi:hypothetical protein
VGEDKIGKGGGKGRAVGDGRDKRRRRRDVRQGNRSGRKESIPVIPPTSHLISLNAIIQGIHMKSTQENSFA